MITEAGAAISGIKAAFDIAKGISALKSETEINQAIIGIQRVLLEAQQAALQDKQHIADLSDRLRETERSRQASEKWTDEKERYKLTKSELGAFTYDLRTELANGEAPHRLCVTCFQEGRKSILHSKSKHSGGEVVICHTCKSDLMLAKFNHSAGQSRISMF